MIRQRAKSKGRKIFIGLSGGVDSAVSAALLKREGYDVTGVFIKVWQPDWISCTWKEERRSAMRVAAHLDIPFATLDLTNEYKESVIDQMIKEYALGRTPNPDVVCNRYVKFGGFWKWAEAQGADLIATGHYARVAGDEASGYSLLAGADTNKDQSYFLWTLDQDDLPHILFPVGDMTKPEVRKLARKFGLPNAEKKDSQGLCFIGKVDVKDFLSHYIETKAGNVLDGHGEIIGTHPGALFFTNGERHGFTITGKTPNDAPFYVIDKDVEQNTITVSNKEPGAISSPGSGSLVRIANVNWIGGKVPDAPDDQDGQWPLQARSRYRQTLQNVRIASVGIAETELEFEKPQDALSPGQSLVIYDGNRCLGGGIIE
jgi:tRNA-specific 2-thiouridylase